MRRVLMAMLLLMPCTYAYAAKGTISASPNPCTIAAGQSTCTETITWSSDNASAQVYTVDPATGTTQLFASGKTGSQAASWVAGLRRMELRVGTTVLASVDISGQAAPGVSVNLSMSPSSGLVAPATVSVSATATGSFAAIRFFNGGSFICQAASPGPYNCPSYTFNTAGSYSLTATALDASGATLATSNTVTATVTAAAPSAGVTLSMSPNAGLVAPAAVTLSAATSGSFSAIRMFVGGTQICSVASPGPYTCNYTFPSANTYTVTATAVSASGTTLATSNTVTASVVAASTGPVLASGSSTGSDGYTIALTGTGFAADASVDVRTATGSAILASYSGAQLTRTGSTGLSFYIADATQRSNLDSTGLRFWVVNPSTGQFDGGVLVTRTAPSVSVNLTMSPVSGLVAPAAVTLSASTSGSFSAIRMFVGGSQICSVAVPGPYSCSYTFASAGSYSVSATAVNASGVTLATSNSVTAAVTSPIAAPVLSSAASTGSDGYTIALTGTGFAADAYVDVRTATGNDILASYMGSQLTRTGSTGLSFYIADATQRSNLDSTGLRFWVVNPSTGQFDGPKSATHAPPLAGKGGSNLIWYYVGPASQDCAREDYAIVTDYHRMLPSVVGSTGTVRDYVRGLLAQMYGNGQRRLRIGIYVGAGINTGPVDATGVTEGTVQDFLPGLPSQYLTNLGNFLADIRAAGYQEVLVSFFYQGTTENPSPWQWTAAYRSDLYNAYANAIAQVHPVVANAGIPYKIDLAQELMPAKSNGSTQYNNWNKFGHDLWSWYVSQ